MLEGFLAADTFRRVKRQHLGEQIEREGRGVRVERLELDSRFDREGSDVSAGKSQQGPKRAER